MHLDIRCNRALISDPGRTGPQGARQGGIMVMVRKGNKWKLKEVLYDPAGTAFGLFGEGVSQTENSIVGGTDTLLYPLYYGLFGISPAIPGAAFLNNGKALVFKKK